MTETRITDQECADCFEALWQGAFEARPFDAVCTLLRVAGLEDPGWDPFEESQEAMKDYNWHLKAKSDELSDKSQWRVGLLMYCQACEMSAIHATLANLLRIHSGQPYHLNPLGSLGRSHKKRMFKWYPPSAKAKWHKLREMAESANKHDLVRLIDNVYNDAVRNAFSHSDYIFTQEDFRWTEGGLPGRLPLQNLNNLIANAFSFFGPFIGVRERWLALAAGMRRYYRWPNFEVFELLKSDGMLNGFRVHFSNGVSARFLRSPDGVDLMNVTIQRDGTINFFVGPLYELQQKYVVDGREVEFGGQSVDTFLQPPIFFRVVRHTLNEQGKLAERAVLSGQHKTRDDARVALELEAAKNTPSSFDPASGNWRITDREGKAHWLMIDPF
jgi:hypothetical protein